MKRLLPILLLITFVIFSFIVSMRLNKVTDFVVMHAGEIMVALFIISIGMYIVSAFMKKESYKENKFNVDLIAKLLRTEPKRWLFVTVINGYYKGRNIVCLGYYPESYLTSFVDSDKPNEITIYLKLDKSWKQRSREVYSKLNRNITSNTLLAGNRIYYRNFFEPGDLYSTGRYEKFSEPQLIKVFDALIQAAEKVSYV